MTNQCQSCILLSAVINSVISSFVHSHSCLSPVHSPHCPWKSKRPPAFGFPVQRPPPLCSLNSNKPPMVWEGGNQLVHNWSGYSIVEAPKFHIFTFKLSQLTLMSRIECKYCLISTSYLVELFDIFHITSYYFDRIV